MCGESHGLPPGQIFQFLGVTRTLRPAALQDDLGRGAVALGPTEIHEKVAREDVAETLAAIIHESGISRQIMELNGGDTPINEALLAAVRDTTSVVRDSGS